MIAAKSTIVADDGIALEGINVEVVFNKLALANNSNDDALQCYQPRVERIIIIRVLRLAFLCYFLYSEFRLFALSQSYITLLLYFNSEFYCCFPVWNFLQYITVHRPTSHHATHRPEQGASSALKQKRIARWKRRGEDVPRSAHIRRLLKLMSTIRGDVVTCLLPPHLTLIKAELSQEEG